MRSQATDSTETNTKTTARKKRLLVIGLIVSIAQAVTQIQEQTLSFVPKIAAMILVAVALLGWISTQMVEFAQQMFILPT